MVTNALVFAFEDDKKVHLVCNLSLISLVGWLTLTKKPASLDTEGAREIQRMMSVKCSKIPAEIVI